MSLLRVGHVIQKIQFIRLFTHFRFYNVLMVQNDNDIDPVNKMIFTYHINCGLNFDLDEDVAIYTRKGYNAQQTILKVIDN